MSKRSITSNMTKILMLRNIQHNIRNPRGIDSQLPKTMYCGLETVTYKGREVWQQLPEKIKKITL